MSDKPSFLDQLKRRKAVRLAALYLVGPWLLQQVAWMGLPVSDAANIR